MNFEYEPGQLVAYLRAPGSENPNIELGVVKSADADGCFVAYHLGDTVAKTPYHNLRPIENAYALKGLLKRSVQLGVSYDGLSEGCEDWSIS